VAPLKNALLLLLVRELDNAIDFLHALFNFVQMIEVLLLLLLLFLVISEIARPLAPNHCSLSSTHNRFVLQQ
jgi:biopolymer transport protein ExbD